MGLSLSKLFYLLPQMGGAMAPPMKELPRWLLDNPEFSVAPDWTDIVKQSVSNPTKTHLELHCRTNVLIIIIAPVLAGCLRVSHSPGRIFPVL